MTMTVDPNQQRFGSLHFDNMSYSNQPHFTNPWGSSSAGQNGSHGMYVGQQSNTVLPHLNLNGLSKPPPPAPRTTPSSSMASYGSIPVTAASAGSSLMADAFGQRDLLTMPQDLLSLNRLQHPASTGYDTAAYTTAASASPVNATYATSPTPYQLGYAPAPMRSAFAMPEPDPSRRYSQQSVSSVTSSLDPRGSSDLGTRPPRNSLIDFDNRHDVQPDDRKRFQDALEASQGMLSMSQDTPRNIYDVRRERGSTDSYGFPAHSTNSSVSSAAGSMGYYGGSVDGSVSDYSTAGSDIESLSGRTLPRPQGLMSAQPPAPQSMMSSFSSKMVSGTQKKHKCKVCDKRFTRPSSLQTHMYSHTGEKPFACDVEGCGRHFSVVSNLRRHRKVHKGASDADSTAETPSEAGSEDHQSESDEKLD
ncbi:hypothetical protein GQ53DRAFT_97786 [Thozetella sp. PMI_491]|nr:hypothetical protein GQ53DRAFT_97786 [Thozetella sp. PMI_491]